MRPRIPTMLALIGAGIFVAMLVAAKPAQARRRPNDNFSNAASFGSVPGQVIGRNNDATRQVGEPNNGSATVWWRWTATKSGRYRVDTCETLPRFDSVVGVYTGSSVSQLVQRARASRTGCPGAGAATYFDAVAGKTYHISVGSYFSSRSSQNIRLSLSRAP